MIGSNKVSSRSYNCVSEYISFIVYGLVFSGVCCLMGDIEGGKWMYDGGCVGCVVLLRPSIAGLAGADTWFGHVTVCWDAGGANSTSPLSWWLLFSGVGVISGVESGMGAGAAHREDVVVLSHFAVLPVIEVSAAVSACTLASSQKSSP